MKFDASQNGVRAVAEHLAWRYGLSYFADEDERLILTDSSQFVELSSSDEAISKISHWLRNPLAREGGNSRGELDCPLDDLERFWLDRAKFNTVPIALPRKCRVWLTHDIDQLRMSYQVLSWSYSMLRRNEWREAVDVVTEWVSKRLKGGDPFWNLERILEIENEYKVRASYFFLHQRVVGSWWELNKIPFHFGLYSLADPIVQDLVKHIEKCGGEVGIHGSLGSARNYDWLIEELELLHRCGVKRPKIARQHCLDFDQWDTVEILNRAGITLDSSIGFNAPGWGFRLRTAWPTCLPAASEDKISDIIHISPCLQDGALHGDWKKQLGNLLEVATERKATICVLWHNSAWAKSPSIEESYKWFIEEAASAGADFVVGEDLLNLYSKNEMQ